MPPTITYLTDIWIGAGVAGELAGVLAKWNVRRPLVVTDRGVVASGLLERVATPGGAVVFDAVESNPDEASVIAGVALYRENGCDGIVAVGGGSPIDCAKGIALMAT